MPGRIGSQLFNPNSLLSVAFTHRQVERPKTPIWMRFFATELAQATVTDGDVRNEVEKDHIRERRGKQDTKGGNRSVVVPEDGAHHEADDHDRQPQTLRKVFLQIEVFGRAERAFFKTREVDRFQSDRTIISATLTRYFRCLVKRSVIADPSTFRTLKCQFQWTNAPLFLARVLKSRWQDDAPRMTEAPRLSSKHNSRLARQDHRGEFSEEDQRHSDVQDTSR